LNTSALTGRLVDDPVTLIDQGGTKITRFMFAYTPQLYSHTDARWVNGETVVLPVLARGPLGERAAQTLTASQQVIVIGGLRSRDGNLEIRASDLGVPLSAIPTR
jgi:single-stranded DNA-binding protein